MQIYLSIYLSVYLSIYLSIVLSFYLSICKLENEASLGDFLSFWISQHQNAAILRDFLKMNVATSKTKEFCEASSIFEVDNIKKEAILRDFFQ